MPDSIPMTMLADRELYRVDNAFGIKVAAWDAERKWFVGPHSRMLLTMSPPEVPAEEQVGAVCQALSPTGINVPFDMSIETVIQAIEGRVWNSRLVTFLQANQEA